MRPKLTDDELIALFNSPGTLWQLAQREGVRSRDLNRGWQRLKSKRMLPLHRPSELYRPGGDDDEQDNREHEFDGRPSVNAGDPDPLLTKLREHHRLG